MPSRPANHLVLPAELFFVDRSHGFVVKKVNVATGNVSTIAGGEQTGWRDGVGEDALFYGSPPGEREDGDDGSVAYCQSAMSSDGLTLLVYDASIRQVSMGSPLSALFSCV